MGKAWRLSDCAPSLPPPEGGLQPRLFNYAAARDSTRLATRIDLAHYLIGREVMQHVPEPRQHAQLALPDDAVKAGRLMAGIDDPVFAASHDANWHSNPVGSAPPIPPPSAPTEWSPPNWPSSERGAA
jgi:hypothetical protein